MKNLKRLFLLAFLATSLFSACKEEKKAPAETTVTEPVKSAADIAAEEAASRATALESARLDSIAAATAAKEEAARLKAEAAAAKKAGTKAAPPKVVVKPKPKPKPVVPSAPPADINTQGEATALGGLGGDRQLGAAENANVLKRPGRDNVLTIYEVKPAYPGGDKAMTTFLNKNIKYPNQAKEDGVKGTVYVKFVVEKDGTVDDVVISKGVHPLLDAEAMRVVKAMPKWAAGKQAGQVVATQFTLPVKFQLVD